MQIAVTAVVTAVVTCFLTWLIMRSADRRKLINDVADQYKELVRTGKNSGVGAMIQAGVCRLRSHREVLDALAVIRDYGLGDPFGSRRELLDGKDLRHFFVLARGERYSVVHEFDWDAVVKSTRSL